MCNKFTLEKQSAFYLGLEENLKVFKILVSLVMAIISNLPTL